MEEKTTLFWKLKNNVEKVSQKNLFCFSWIIQNICDNLTMKKISQLSLCSLKTFSKKKRSYGGERTLRESFSENKNKVFSASILCFIKIQFDFGCILFQHLITKMILLRKTFFLERENKNVLQPDEQVSVSLKKQKKMKFFLFTRELRLKEKIFLKK